MTDLKPGDLAAVPASGTPDQKRVTKVTAEVALSRTRVDLENADRDAPPYVFVPASTYANADHHRHALRERQRPVVGGRQPVEGREDLSAFVTMQGWDLGALEVTVATGQAQAPVYAPQASDAPLPPAQVGVYAFKVRVGPFGNNAPRWGSLPVDQRVAATGAPAGDPPYPSTSNWDGSSEPPITEDSAGTPSPSRTSISNGPSPRSTGGSWVVLERSDGISAYRVEGTLDTSLADFALSARVTGITVRDPDGTAPTGLSDFKMRSTTIHADSRFLALAGLPI